MKTSLTIGLLLLQVMTTIHSFAQGVAINENGNQADIHAIMDISSHTKGILIPRMTAAERSTLGATTPTEGMLVYDSDSSSFYYYDGRWVRLAAGNITSGNNSVVITEPIILSGNAIVYQEFRVPASAAKTAGTGVPLYSQVNALGNIFEHFFQDVNQAQNEQSVYFNVQMPFTWLEGSAIYPHIHWMPSTTGTGTLRWGLEYTWINIDGTFGPTTIIYTSETINNNRYKHIETDFSPAFIDASGKTSGSMLLCRLFRNSSNAIDTYTGDGILLEFDFKYKVNKLGTPLAQ